MPTLKTITITVLLLLGMTLTYLTVANKKTWYNANFSNAAYTSHCDGNMCEIYLSDEIVRPNQYTNLITLIDTAPKGAVINLHLSGNGGMVDSIVNISNAIELSHAEVNTIVEGPVYSAHAWLAMEGKHITIAPYALFMFHVPAVLDPLSHQNIMTKDICRLFVGARDRGQDAQQKCVDSDHMNTVLINNLFKKYIYPKLTTKEIEDMAAGHDIYIIGTDMQNRLNPTEGE